MPVVDQIDCPHCKTKKSGFTVVGTFRCEGTHHKDGRGGTFFTNEDWLQMTCGSCMKSIVAVYKYNQLNADFKISLWLTNQGSPKKQKYQYVEHFPSSHTKLTPKHVPEKVAVPYEQALSNLASSNFDAAGTMARKTLEITTKDIVRTNYENQEEEQKKLISQTWLKQRIKKLHEKGLLTDGLVDLAFLIKDEGDGAAHDEEPYDEPAAKELIEYAEALLTYVYTIPGMVNGVKKIAETSNEGIGSVIEE